MGNSVLDKRLERLCVNGMNPSVMQIKSEAITNDAFMVAAYDCEFLFKRIQFASINHCRDGCDVRGQESYRVRSSSVFE